MQTKEQKWERPENEANATVAGIMRVLGGVLTLVCVHVIFQVGLLRQSDQHPNVVRYFCMVSYPLSTLVYTYI